MYGTISRPHDRWHPRNPASPPSFILCIVDDSTPEPKMTKEPEKKPGQDYIGVGVGSGVALGTALGAAFGNVGMGLAIGIVVGVAIGVVLSRAKRKEAGS